MSLSFSLPTLLKAYSVLPTHAYLFITSCNLLHQREKEREVGEEKHSRSTTMGFV